MAFCSKFGSQQVENRRRSNHLLQRIESHQKNTTANHFQTQGWEQDVSEKRFLSDVQCLIITEGAQWEGGGVIL